VPCWLGWLVLVAGLLTALLTAAYATRLWLLAFRGPSVRPAIALPADAHGSTGAMSLVLWLLAVPALALGVVGLRDDWLPAFLDGNAAEFRPALSTSLLGVGLAVVGCAVMAVAWRVAVRREVAVAAGRATQGASAVQEAAVPPELEARPGETPADLAPALAAETAASLAEAEAVVPTPSPAHLLLGPLLGPAARGFGIDRLYQLAFVLPTEYAARLVRFLDAQVVETYVIGAAGSAGLLGRLVRRAQNGNAQGYLSALFAGVVVLAVVVAVAW
jgi:NADH-quinone oxidoreductase subunit L